MNPTQAPNPQGQQAQTTAGALLQFAVQRQALSQTELSSIQTLQGLLRLIINEQQQLAARITQLENAVQPLAQSVNTQAGLINSLQQRSMPSVSTQPLPSAADTPARRSARRRRTEEAAAADLPPPSPAAALERLLEITPIQTSIAMLLQRLQRVEAAAAERGDPDTPEPSGKRARGPSPEPSE